MAPVVLEDSSECTHADNDFYPKWSAPSDAALVAHNSVHDEIRGKCWTSSTSSTSSGSTSSSDDDRFATLVAVDSDDEADQYEPAPDILSAVELHLENMNVASEEVNEVQGALKVCAKHQQALERDWAHCEQLAKSIGMRSLTKAVPYHHQRQRCKFAREAVEQASSQYQASLQDTDIEIAKHAACVAEYHAAEQMLTKVKTQTGLSQKVLDVALLYLDAQEEHRKQMTVASLTMKKLEQHLDSAKSRYRFALRSLEALSEHEHRQRSSAEEL